MSKRDLLVAVIGATAGLSRLSVHASSVTNTPILAAVDFWGPSPVGNESYGLVFTAPESTLDDLSLTVSDFDAPFPFVSQVYAWDGSETIGPALYTSGVGDTTSSLTTYTYSPDMHVTAGDQYVAFVTNQPGGISLGGSGSGLMQRGFGPAAFRFATHFTFAFIALEGGGRNEPNPFLTIKWPRRLH